MFAKNYRKRYLFKKSYGKNKTVQFFLPHSVLLILLLQKRSTTTNTTVLL